jgi:hypothetical protein
MAAAARRRGADAASVNVPGLIKRLGLEESDVRSRMAQFESLMAEASARFRVVGSDDDSEALRESVRAATSAAAGILRDAIKDVNTVLTACYRAHGGGGGGFGACAAAVAGGAVGEQRRLEATSIRLNQADAMFVKMERDMEGTMRSTPLRGCRSAAATTTTSLRGTRDAAAAAAAALATDDSSTHGGDDWDAGAAAAATAAAARTMALARGDLARGGAEVWEDIVREREVREPPWSACGDMARTYVVVMCACLCACACTRECVCAWVFDDVREKCVVVHYCVAARERCAEARERRRKYLAWQQRWKS